MAPVNPSVQSVPIRVWAGWMGVPEEAPGSDEYLDARSDDGLALQVIDGPYW